MLIRIPNLKFLMSLFLKGDGVVTQEKIVKVMNFVRTPEDIMKSAISREEFKKSSYS